MNRTEVSDLRSELVNSAKDFQNWNDNSYFTGRVQDIADFVASALIDQAVEVEFEERTLRQGIDRFCEGTLRSSTHFLQAGRDLALRVAGGGSTPEERARLLIFYGALKESFDYVLGR